MDSTRPYTNADIKYNFPIFLWRKGPTKAIMKPWTCAHFFHFGGPLPWELVLVGGLQACSHSRAAQCLDLWIPRAPPASESLQSLLDIRCCPQDHPPSDALSSVYLHLFLPAKSSTLEHLEFQVDTSKFCVSLAEQTHILS